MPTMPDPDEPRQATSERVARALRPVTAASNRPLALLVAAAGAGSLAPDPFGVIVAMACVIAASDLARKR